MYLLPKNTKIKATYNFSVEIGKFPGTCVKPLSEQSTMVPEQAHIFGHPPSPYDNIVTSFPAGSPPTSPSSTALSSARATNRTGPTERDITYISFRRVYLSHNVKWIL